MIMIQKPLILFFLSLISMVNGDDQNFNCQRFINKVYQLTVTFPGQKSLYAILRLLPNGAFDELFNIANGNNAAELGVSFPLSDRIGRYKCVGKNVLRLSGLGYLYKTDGIPFLQDNGAIVIHDYYFRFSNNDKSCTGVVKFAVFTSGTNPYSTTDQPVHVGDIGTVKCDLLKFRTYYDLSNQV